MTSYSNQLKIINLDEIPLIQQHKDLQARAKELGNRLADVAEAHGDLSEIEAAVELINKEREVLEEKKGKEYAQVKKVLLSVSSIEGQLGILSILKEDLVPFLIKAMGDENGEVQSKATEALERIGPKSKEAVPILIEALKDENEKVRSTAAYVLGGIGLQAKDAVPALVKVLGDKYEHVGFLAAEALMFILPDSVLALIKALRDENMMVRANAAFALGGIGPGAKDAVPALIQALGDEYIYVRGSAAEALGNIGLKDPAAIKKLEEILISDQDEHVKKAALEALNKLKGAS